MVNMYMSSWPWQSYHILHCLIQAGINAVTASNRCQTGVGFQQLSLHCLQYVQQLLAHSSQFNSKWTLPTGFSGIGTVALRSPASAMTSALE